MKTTEIGGLRPVNPERLTGPVVGELCHYRSSYPRFDGLIVRVTARSYVWAPDVRGSDGYYGHRRYDWTVIEWFEGEHRHHMVVDDVDLTAITPGMRMRAYTWKETVRHD